MDRLPSGSYRVSKMVDGKRYSLTFDHKPSKKEIELALSAKIGEKVDKHHMSFEEASKEYVNLKRNVLSPATIREYDRTCGRLPGWFTQMDIAEIDQTVMQRLVNELAIDKSAKTVKDRHAFCVGVIRLFYPSREYFTTLPKKPLKEPYIPTHDDVKRILEASKGTLFEIALQLACYGMRREEICAVLTSDLDEDGFLVINKALVQDSNKNWVVKQTKTIDSTRVIAIDKDLAEQIRELPEGRIYNGYPESIATFMRRMQDKLGIEHFSLHKMRHYFCSTLYENNVSETDILALGGWKQSSNVMKEIYKHSNIQREKERMKNAASLLKTART